jgi:hypothetical protein
MSQNYKKGMIVTNFKSKTFVVPSFCAIFAAVRYSTSYHNKAICRRIISYMPSSGGHFYCMLSARFPQSIKEGENAPKVVM